MTEKPVATKISKSGKLFKRGRSRLTNWKERFITLSAEDGKLSLKYYADQSMSAQKGAVSIAARDQVVDSLEHIAAPLESFIFCVKSDSESAFYMAATSESDRDDWVAAIRNVSVQTCMTLVCSPKSKYQSSLGYYIDWRKCTCTTQSGSSG